MGNRLLGIAVFLCAVSFSFAAQKTVTANSASDLVEKCANAQAGDTIWVPAGDYDLSKVSTKDPGRTKDGWDRGMLWLGPNNGTAEHPIVLVGRDVTNPPSIHGQLNSNYSLIVHINNDYVILKNLKLHSAYAGINIDNANHVTIEDCEIYHTGQEIVHVRDGSTYVRLNRNHIHDSGNAPDKGTYGEGIYVGTSMESWGILGESPNELWGTTAKQYYAQNKPTYYDWRVNHVDISCNLMHAISSENIDIKEGTQDIVISKNMFSADSLYLKSGPRDCDNSFVEVKGVRSTIVRNYLYTANNSHLTAYIDEYNRSGSGSNVPANLTPDKNSNIWCDNSASDGNQCGSGDNMFIGYIGEVRNLCSETFTIPEYPITYSDKKYQAVPAFPWVATSVSQKYEAENATIIEYASGRTDNPAAVVANASASNGKYVAMKNGNLQFNVNVSEKGKYNLIVHYSFATSDASAHKEQGLTVNGTNMGTLWFGVTDASKLTFKDVSTDIWLNDGSNTILLTRDWGWVDVDYIEVRGAGQYEELFPKQNVPASSSSSAQQSSSSIKQSSSSAKSSSSAAQSSSSLKSSSSVESSSSSAAQSSSSVASSSSAKSSSSSVETVEQSSSSEIFSSSTQAVEPQTSSSMEVLKSSSSETYSPSSDDLINDESSSSSYEIPSSDSNEQGLAVVLPGKYAMVPVLGKVFRLKVPSSENYRVNVFDYNGNVVRQLHSGRYIIRVESRNYNYVTSVIVK